MFCFELPGSLGVKRAREGDVPASFSPVWFLPGAWIAVQARAQGHRARSGPRFFRGARGATGCGRVRREGRMRCQQSPEPTPSLLTPHPSCLARVTGELTMTFPAGIVRVFSGTPPPPVLSFRLVHTSAIEHFQPNADLLFRYWRGSWGVRGRGSQRLVGSGSSLPVNSGPASWDWLCGPGQVTLPSGPHCSFLLRLPPPTPHPPPPGAMLARAQSEPGNPPL